MSKPAKKSQKSQTQDSAPADDSSPAKGKGSHGDKRILSIAIDPQLHSRLALLARAEGKSVTALVVESVSRNLKARIETALESLRADLNK